ncbi:MAG: forkhead-associated protein [Planctomycetaceae bacterium]|nr:forkhead-associated protein [Planctomycetaceae bacterium]
MLGELVPCGGGDPIPLLKAKLLIGRRSRCDIALRFPNVSSHHCELELVNGYWYVRDMNSRNGVKVNNERCENKWLLPGDILSVAKHRYEILYTPTSEGPPPDIDEDPFARSLLEKAGLERRQPNRPQVPPGRPKLDDDDLAMDWLSDDG